MIGVPLLVLAACQCETEAPDPAQAARRAPYEKRVKRLTAMGESASRALEEKPCASDVVGRLDGGDALVLVADQRFLAGLAASGVDAGHWAWVTSPALAKLPALGTLSDARSVTNALYAMKQLDAEYQFLAVLAATRREPPRMEAQRFHGGQLEGWLVLFDLQSDERLCQTRLSATSSQEVAGTQGQSQSAALWTDFALQVRGELERAAERLGRGFNLELGG